MTLSAISQAARALEARVGAALFIRTTRSVGLTEASERFFSHVNPAFEELVAASELARDLGQRPAELLRLAVPRRVVALILEPVIASFCRAYPEIELEIAASEQLVDLAAGGFDAGIRLGQFIAPDMVALRLTAPFPLVVVSSPEYLGERQRPERIDDLREPAIQGVGLAQVPGPLAKAPIADGRLQALLTPFVVTTPGVFLYYVGRPQALPKLRAFVEHVKYRGAKAPRHATTARRSRTLDRANSS